MNTPHNPEAVEAAINFAGDKILTRNQWSILEPETYSIAEVTALHILAAEVERLRTELMAIRDAIESEPELPGDMPYELFYEVRQLDHKGLEAFLRSTVRGVKHNILTKVAKK